jgi:hypothetical protein
MAVNFRDIASFEPKIRTNFFVMKLQFFCLCIFLCSAIVTHAQDHGDKGYVLYDPLFWKSQLKLDPSQCEKIREINSQFYEKLSAVAHEQKNQNEIRQMAVETLMQRSDKIWETFDPKQRRIGKRCGLTTPELHTTSDHRIKRFNCLFPYLFLQHVILDVLK